MDGSCCYCFSGSCWCTKAIRFDSSECTKSNHLKIKSEAHECRSDVYLTQNPLDHVPVDIRQPEVAARIPVSQLCVIQPHRVQQRAGAVAQLVRGPLPKPGVLVTMNLTAVTID